MRSEWIGGNSKSRRNCRVGRDATGLKLGKAYEESLTSGISSLSPSQSAGAIHNEASISHHIDVVRIAFLIPCRRHFNKLGIVLHLYNRFRATIA